MTDTTDAPDMMDVLRPLFALQEKFLIEWQLMHMPIGSSLASHTIDGDDVPEDGYIQVHVQIDVPREIAQQLHLARLMFEPR